MMRHSDGDKENVKGFSETTASAEIQHRLQQLVEAANKGEVAAIEQLFELEYAHLRQLARGAMARLPIQHLVGSQTIIHEAYVRFRQRDEPRLSFATLQDFRRYVHRMMRNLLIDYLRHRQRRPEGHLIEILSAEGVNDAESFLRKLRHDGLRNMSGDPPRALLVMELLERFNKAFPDDAQIIQSHWLDGETGTQIIERMGITRTQFNGCVSRAKTWFRRQLALE